MKLFGTSEPAGNNLIGGEEKKEPVLPVKEKMKLEGYSDTNLRIDFEIDNRDSSKGEERRIVATFVNLGASEISGLNMQVALQKNLKMIELKPATDSVVYTEKRNFVQQEIRFENTMDGIKPIAMKIKLTYILNGQTVNGTKVVSFPLNA